MAPTHDQLANAVERHLIRLDANIEDLKAKKVRAETARKASLKLTDNRALCEKIILVGFAVHDVDAYDYSNFDTDTEWSGDRRHMTFSFTATHTRTKTRMRVTLPVGNPGADLALKRDKEINRVNEILDKDRDNACTQIELLTKLRGPSNLNSFRSYLRAQWAPAKATVQLSDAALAALSESFLATRNASSCEIG